MEPSDDKSTMREPLVGPGAHQASAPYLPHSSIPLPVVDAYSISDTIKRHWPLDVCECFGYVDPVRNDCVWFPYFLPMAICSPCCLVGKIQTLLNGEREVCCEMGEKGLLCCCISSMPTLFSPLGGACFFAMLSAAWRQDMNSRYNMAELPPTCTCFGSLNPTCEFVHLACLYPCSFFQIWATLREIGNEQRGTLHRPYVP